MLVYMVEIIFLYILLVQTYYEKYEFSREQYEAAANTVRSKLFCHSNLLYSV